jgi:pimeloyl-ACP methyl ester carboxylesterase
MGRKVGSMLLMPFGLLSLWITGLLSLGLLGGGVYLIWAWYEGVVVETGYLVAGLAMVAFTFFGRPLVVWLLRRRRGADEPVPTRGGTAQRIPRPDGTELHVESYGPPDAPALILTHGWGLNSTEWHYAKRHLADRFRVIVWDLPGLGRSRRPKNNDYDLEKMARDLEAVVTLAGNHPVVLLGHSIGGMITLTFCRLFPQHLQSRVAGLVLTHTTYTNPVKTSKFSGFFRAAQKPLLQPLLYLMIVLSPLVRLMNWLSYLNGMTHVSAHLTHFGGRETRGQLEFLARFSLFAPPPVVARGVLAMFRYDATATLPAIPLPTLVIAGNRDQSTLPEASERIRADVPRAELIELTPGGHLGLLEQHEKFVGAVGAFGAACLGAARTARP